MENASPKKHKKTVAGKDIKDHKWAKGVRGHIAKAVKEYAISNDEGLMVAEPFANKMYLANASAIGVPVSVLTDFEESEFFTKPEIAKMFGVTTRTLQRYSHKTKLNPQHTEKLLQLAEVVYEGVKVFESKEKFDTWFNKPCYALGGVTPKSLLTTSYGVEMVLGELNAIEHGIFA